MATTTKQRYETAIQKLKDKGARDVKFFFEPASLSASGSPGECTERALNTLEAIANGQCAQHPRFMSKAAA